MRCRNRRGAVLVLAALLMVAVLGTLVIVVDFSRIYLQENELQTAADVAALAGVMELGEGAPQSMIKDSAIFYGQKNKALKENITIATADVRCGFWLDSAEAYTGPSDFCSSTDNSVTVTTRAPAKYSIPGLFKATWQVTATARAYSAYVGTSKCIKPWAIPYTKLTKTLQPTNSDTLRDIDSTDAVMLRSMTVEERTFMLKIGTPPNQGNFGSLEIPSSDPAAPNGGANLYSYNIEQCNPTLIGPGDTIETEPGNMKGPTDKGVEAWCTNNGSFQKSTGNCYDEEGNLGVVVKAALWSQATTKANGRYSIIVRQIVSFVLENLSNQTEITGHFLPFLTAGSITHTPTTVQRPILVK